MRLATRMALPVAAVAARGVALMALLLYRAVHGAVTAGVVAEQAELARAVMARIDSVVSAALEDVEAVAAATDLPDRVPSGLSPRPRPWPGRTSRSPRRPWRRQGPAVPCASSWPTITP